jgi:mannose-1-phosphate guanylyltransferase
MVEQELVPELAGTGRLLGHPAGCYWMDAGTPARYLQLHHDLLTGCVMAPIAMERRPGWPGIVPASSGSPLAAADGSATPAIDPMSLVDGPCVLGAGTRIGERAAVSGPASLGANVVVDDGAFVAGSVLWDGCRIGPHARVTGSVLASGCVVETGARVEDSVLGDRARVPAGVTVRNACVNPGETAVETARQFAGRSR